MEPATPKDESNKDIPTIAADQDRQHMEASWQPLLGELASDSQKRRSTAAEEDWQLVSREGSPSPSQHASSPSSRASFEVATHSDHASVCSEGATQNEALADSVLSQPMETPQHAEAAASDSTAASAGCPDSLDALRSLSQLSQEGSIDGFSDEEAAPQEAGAAAEDAPTVRRLARIADAFVKHVAAAQAGVGARVAEAGEQLERELALISKWMLDSMAAVVQGTRAGGEAVRLTLAAALDRLHDLLPKKDGKGDHKEVSWGVLGLAAGCIVAAASAVFAVYKNFKLSRDLHSRDRELAKLVMRVVSLQEILNSHRHMPITRYTSYGYAHTLL